jgi:hypothetical protein
VLTDAHERLADALAHGYACALGCCTSASRPSAHAERSRQLARESLDFLASSGAARSIPELLGLPDFVVQVPEPTLVGGFGLRVE